MTKLNYKISKSEIQTRFKQKDYIKIITFTLSTTLVSSLSRILLSKFETQSANITNKFIPKFLTNTVKHVKKTT